MKQLLFALLLLSVISCSTERHYWDLQYNDIVNTDKWLGDTTRWIYLTNPSIHKVINDEGYEGYVVYMGCELPFFTTDTVGVAKRTSCEHWRELVKRWDAEDKVRDKERKERQYRLTHKQIL